MEKIKDFKIGQIPLQKVVIVATSNPDYEMDRTILVEDYLRYSDYVVISGGHCSCYDFEGTEIEWEAIQYSATEVRKLATGWLKNGYGSEEIIAPLILSYVEANNGE